MAVVEVLNAYPYFNKGTLIFKVYDMKTGYLYTMADYANLIYEVI